MSISIPLKLEKGALGNTSDIRKAINESLRLLLNTTCGEFVPDPQYGFILNNLRFEIFDEQEGEIYNSKEDPMDRKDLYNKKVQGTSKSVNTFAIDVRQAINRYENRLSNVDVFMSYDKDYRRIRVEVKAMIKETLEVYNFVTYINVWN